MSEETKKFNNLAEDVLKLARNTLVVNLRFMDKAISMLQFQFLPGFDGMSVDGQKIYYDPVSVLKDFLKEKTKMTNIMSI